MPAAVFSNPLIDQSSLHARRLCDAANEVGRSLPDHNDRRISVA
jgi:hypothetical protein